VSDASSLIDAEPSRPARNRGLRTGVAIAAVAIIVGAVFVARGASSPNTRTLVGAESPSAADTTSSEVAGTTTSTPGGQPVAMDTVPSSDTQLPASGIEVQKMVLLPPPNDAAPAVDRSAALTAASKIDNNPTVTASDALLVSFTDPGTLTPPEQSTDGTSDSYSPIQNRLAWVVTVTAPNASNVSQAPGHVFMAQHNELVFDANSGAFLEGFFTK
jgi:hypothetical protein